METIAFFNARISPGYLILKGKSAPLYNWQSQDGNKGGWPLRHCPPRRSRGGKKQSPRGMSQALVSVVQRERRALAEGNRGAAGEEFGEACGEACLGPGKKGRARETDLGGIV